MKHVSYSAAQAGTIRAACAARGPLRGEGSRRSEAAKLLRVVYKITSLARSNRGGGYFINEASKQLRVPAPEVSIKGVEL